MTAEQKYKERRKQINDKITKLKSLLNTKDQNFRADNKNWGYVCDLGRISNLLDEIIESMNMD